MKKIILLLKDKILLFILYFAVCGIYSSFGSEKKPMSEKNINSYEAIMSFFEKRDILPGNPEEICHNKKHSNPILTLKNNKTLQSRKRA